MTEQCHLWSRESIVGEVRLRKQMAFISLKVIWNKTQRLICLKTDKDFGFLLYPRSEKGDQEEGIDNSSKGQLWRADG